MPRSVSLIKNDMKGSGGLEKWMDRLTDAFSAKGCPITVLSSSKLDYESSLIHTKHLRIRSPFAFQKLEQFDRRAARYIEKNPTDIVFGIDRSTAQTHHRAGNGVHRAYLESRKKYESPFKQKSFEINPLHRKILQIEKASFESPHLRKVFTNSHMVKREILEYYDVDESKISVVHNGAEWKELEKPFSLWVEKKSKVCRRLDVDPTLYQFLFIGNGYARKGLDLLLKALSHLPKRTFHLSVVGKDKKCTDYIKLAHSLGIADDVSFFGPVADVHAFYQLADALVIPSHYDPFANVTVEALAMGVSVVSSKQNGGHEILTPETGVIIPSLQDEEAFAAALTQVMQMPKTWMRSLATRNAVSHLDIQNQLRLITDETLAT